MEKMGEWEQKNVADELVQGRELAKQLQIHIQAPSSSHETCEMLVQRILGSYEKALSMLNWSITSMGEASQPAAGAVVGMSESPPSLTGSPRSDQDSDRDMKHPEYRDASTKKKTLPRWSEQVRVSLGSGLEGSLDDGFCWRKYGQKDILGAKYPRGYYRCTHRNVRGCLATKQVQRSDEDPTIFEIKYRGNHTCTQPSHPSPPAPASPERQDPNNNIESLQHNQPPVQQNQQLLSFQTDLRINTQDLDTVEQQQPFPLLPYFSASSSYVPVVDNHQFSPSFISPPAESGTNNIFSASASTSSATNSQAIGLDFPFDSLEFDPKFTFDNPGFFS